MRADVVRIGMHLHREIFCGVEVLHQNRKRAIVSRGGDSQQISAMSIAHCAQRETRKRSTIDDRLATINRVRKISDLPRLAEPRARNPRLSVVLQPTSTPRARFESGNESKWRQHE